MIVSLLVSQRLDGSATKGFFVVIVQSEVKQEHVRYLKMRYAQDSTIMRFILLMIDITKCPLNTSNSII